MTLYDCNINLKKKLAKKANIKAFIWNFHEYKKIDQSLNKKLTDSFKTNYNVEKDFSFIFAVYIKYYLNKNHYASLVENIKLNFEKIIDTYELANSMIRFFGCLFWASLITLLDMKAIIVRLFPVFKSGLIPWMFQ